MTDRPRLLQGGRARRSRGLPGRRRGRSRGTRAGFGDRADGRKRSYSGRRHTAAFAGLAVVIALLALLGFMAPKAAGPSPVATYPEVGHTTSAPVRSSYGLALAPRRERVNPRLKLGLRSGLLFDVRTGHVLWERNPARVLPIASLTKMMTALVVLAHSRPRDRVLITAAAVHFTGSGVGLLPVHKRVPEIALLYGLLLPSGNDAAIALAQHVAGTQGRFVRMMNARARQLGLRCTHYTTVSGVVDRGNHSCAPDLALLAHEMLEQPLLARIVRSASAIVPFPIKGGKLYLYNNNPLLIERYPGADGVKTGFTDASGPCLVATARRGRAWLGVVLLHSGNIGAQAQTLLGAGFAKLARA